MSMLEEHQHKHPVHEFDGIIENRANRPPAYFAVLFYGLIVWGVIFCAYYLLSGWSSSGEFEEKMAAHQQQAGSAPVAAAAPATALEEAENGKELFASHCAMCHGAEGEGGIGPDLTSGSFKYGRDAADIAESIRNGRPRGMPAFGSQFKAAEIDSLTDFVLSLK
ncbi:monoheme cytochrome c [Desulfuromonas soudanensis]|uniref:Monoheme cytochrome c n=1 Tax=Desulfuromonas soudanensis TaxID=1603606 RepID=A0A0M4CXR8_9BACT|nr:c-type cytochrome [Desulfuromonas soudanensis]ALC17078.1 monoheme cytochrome c [Desulfuromonas soudanensis]